MVRRGGKRNQTAEEYITAGLIHDARYPTVDDLLEETENSARKWHLAAEDARRVAKTVEFLREDRASH